MSRQSVREAWLADVVFSPQLNDACRRVLVLYAMAEDSRGPWMNERGRIRPIKHKVIAQALGIAEKTVANRILEATRKGFLQKDPTTGYRGRAAAYQAAFPRSARTDGPVSLRALVTGALKVPVNEEPSSPVIGEPLGPDGGGKVPAIREAQRVRGRVRTTSERRETDPAPDGSRVERNPVPSFKPAATGGWLPTPVASLSSVLRAEVA